MKIELAIAIARTGLRKSEVAERAGITAAHLSRIINKGVTPHRLTARSLCRVLGVKPADLGWGKRREVDA